MKSLIIKNANFRKNINDFDGNLTIDGISQSHNLANWLRHNIVPETFSGFTSPFLHMIQMASMIYELININFKTDNRIVDFDKNYKLEKFCNFEGIENTEPNQYIDNTLEDSIVFEYRIDNFFKYIKKQNKNIIVISHEIFCLDLIRKLHDGFNEKTTMNNGSLTLIDSGKIVFFDYMVDLC